MLPHSLPYLPSLKAFEHNPFPQRHRVGYDANDHVASMPSLPLPLAMIPRSAVSQVSSILLCHVHSTLEARYTLPMNGLCTPQIPPTWHTAITPHRPRRHSPLHHPRHCPPRPRPYPPPGHPI